jgi:hypothetical protein
MRELERASALSSKNSFFLPLHKGRKIKDEGLIPP